jgi:hypothetical protein
MNEREFKEFMEFYRQIMKEKARGQPKIKEEEDEELWI